jgi:hypothetical protein
VNSTCGALLLLLLLLLTSDCCHCRMYFLAGMLQEQGAYIRHQGCSAAAAAPPQLPQQTHQLHYSAGGSIYEFGYGFKRQTSNCW